MKNRSQQFFKVVLTGLSLTKESSLISAESAIVSKINTDTHAVLRKLLKKILPYFLDFPQYLLNIYKNVCIAFWKPVSALWGCRKIHLKLSNLPVIVCTQRPHRVPTPSTHSHGALTVCTQPHIAFSQGSWRSRFLTYFSYFEQPCFANILTSINTFRRKSS